MVKRKDRTARRQILQLKEEKNRTYLQPGNNIPGVPAEPSPSQGGNDDGAGLNEGSQSEPAPKNGAQRDAIDDQLEDFMKEIDAISTVPGTDTQSGEEKNELQIEQTATTCNASECVLSSETSVQEVNSKEACPPGNVNVPAATESEVPACPWIECMDEATGYTYFWHQLTNEVTWDCPPEYEAYWAQYGEPVGVEGHDAVSVTHVMASETTSATLVPTVAPSSATPSSTPAMSSSQTSLSNTKPTTVNTAEEEKGKPGALGHKSATTVTTGKKRKQASVIGAIIPITSYGASDSSSSEDSDHERYAVQKARLKKSASKRPKVAAKQSQREPPSPVVYGPQLPDSLLCQEEKPAFGPCLPDAPDSAQAMVYGPHLPEEKVDVYGPHLPDPEDLATESVIIGPQLPQFYETPEKVSTGAFIGPQLPDDFYEKRVKPCDEEEPAVHEPCTGSETSDSSQTCMEVGKPGASLEGSTAQESKFGEETVLESEASSVATMETCVASEGAVSALAGLVDYPGSPVVESEAEEMDVEDKPVSMASPHADLVGTPVDYPVMTGGKLQFGNAAEVVHSDEALPEGGVQSSSSVHVVLQLPLGSPAMPGIAKSKRNAEAKKKSQHLVSYGDSESSDDDSEDVDVTAVGSPAAPTARAAPVAVRTEENEEEERHVGLGCTGRSAGEVLDTEGKKPMVTKPFVKVKFVRSDEVLVLGKCTDTGQEVVTEKVEIEEAETGLSPSSDRTAGTENNVSAPECKPSPDSDVDDFEDVVRALDIALLESQKKAAQEGDTKHEARLQDEKRESPHDSSEEEGEIKSSEASSEPGMTPVNLRESDSEEEPEEVKAGAGFKKNVPLSRKATSPKPDNKSAVMLEIGDAYKLLMDQLNPLRDVIACRNSYFELVVKTMTRMEDWRAGALDASYFLQRLHDARAAAAELQVVVANARDNEPDEPCQEPLPPGWQRHWDSGQARYFYVQEQTGHSQWTPPTTTSANGTPDSKAQTAGGEQSQNELAAIASQLAAPPPPPPTGSGSDTAEETTANQEDEARRSAEEAENIDGISLDAAEAAFYSSVALSAEPASSALQEDRVDKQPPTRDTTPKDEVSVPVPAVPAPKKKKTKVSAGLALRKKNIPSLLQKWEKIKEEQKRSMPS